MNGIQAADVICKKLEIPVIFLTSHEEDFFIKEAQKTGSFTYLLKPFNEKELKVNIELALQTYKAKRQLKDISKTREKLFSIISHDLRNPIAAIKRTVEILHERIDHLEKQEIACFLEDLVQTSEKLLELNDNLLNWAKLQTSQINIAEEQIKINYLAEFAQQLHANLLKEKSLQLEITIPEDLIVLCDMQSISIVFSNLLVNAIKYSSSFKSIFIKGSQKDNFAEIVIEDQGIGFQINNLEELLSEPYSTYGTNNEKGFGLGLITCKELIEKNGGKIFIDNNAENGASVRFTLPLPKPDSNSYLLKRFNKS